MSKRLSTILQQPEEIVDGLINKLENLSGFVSHDLRFESQARAKVSEKAGQLGLDPADTTEQELYWGMMHKFETANTMFENAYFSDVTTPEDRLNVVARLAENAVNAEKVWAVKPSAVKRILRKHPPKQLMKQLGYRSLESLLKHEDTHTVLVVAQQTASGHWNDVVNSALGKLPATDYEETPLRAVTLGEKWTKSIVRLPVISSSSQAGQVVLSPNQKLASVAVLSMYVLVAQALESVRLACVASRLPKLANADHPYVASIGGAAITWNSLLFHLGKNHFLNHPEILEPYILPEHMEASSLVERICAAHPVLNFWSDSECLVQGHGANQVSCNIVDVAANYASHSDIGKNTTKAGRSSYWNHLLHKYMQHPAVFDKIITDIENTLAPGFETGSEMMPEFAQLRRV